MKKSLIAFAVLGAFASAASAQSNVTVYGIVDAAVMYTNNQAGGTNKAVMEALDGLPPVKIHCSLLAEEAIHAALWDYAEKHHIKIEGLSKPKSDIHEGEEDTEEEY